MSRTLAAAETLADEIRTALGGLVDLVTIDGMGIKSATRAAIVIQPPKVTYPSWNERELEWTLAAVAGPADRPRIAWERLDAILTRLEESGINLKSADPALFDLAGSGTLPAYEITLNPLEY